MTLLKLERFLKDGGVQFDPAVYINPAAIQSIIVKTEKREVAMLFTIVCLNDGSSYHVQETPEEIKDMLNALPR